MPALPDVPDVIKLTIDWTVEGDATAVTNLFFHYSSGAPDESDLQNWVDNANTSAGTALTPEFLASTSITGMTARDLSSAMGSVAVAIGASPGTRTGTRLPPAAAALMNDKVKRTYRGGKPRSYWPFGASADVAATGFWSDAFVTEYESAVQTFIGDCITTEGGLVVDYQCNVSYYGPPNRVLTNPSTGRARTVSTRRDAPGGTGAPIVDKIVSTTGTKRIGSQRRRNKNA